MIKLEFTLEEINKVLSGLLELPAKTSMNLYLRLQQEAQKQVDELEKKETKSKKTDGN